MMAKDLVNIDLCSQSFMRNPFPVLNQLREVGPVVKVRLPFIGTTWLATSHEVVDEMLKDDSRFVRNSKNAGRTQIAGMRWWMPGIVRVLSQNMLSHDDPDHRRLRKLVDQAFSRQSVDGMRDQISSICDRLLDTMSSSQTVDLLEGFARPLPLAVISELLGLPEADRPQFAGWVRSMMFVTSIWGIFGIFSGLFGLTKYLKRQFQECRQHPRPGLMTALVQAEQDGDRLSEEELLAMAFLLLVAGHETTVNLISGGVVALVDNRDQKDRLLSDWSVVRSAVEELLRFVSPVQISKPRYVSQDMTFHGKTLRKGELLVAMLAGANCDPKRFTSPERLDITRTPNPHMAFGMGMHFCLGAQLARVETQVALEKLFTRYPNLRLATPSSSLTYTGRVGNRALTALPVYL